MNNKYKCPIEKFLKETDISSKSAKQVWYNKRNYCLSECKEGCDILVMLKKIYWEHRKPTT